MAKKKHSTAKKQRKVSLSELEEALKSRDYEVRYHAMFDFAHSEISEEAIPVLRRALEDEHPGVVRYAAVSLGRLGPAACEAMRDLRLAAIRVDTATEMPQSYVECLEALLAIDPTDELTLGMIQDHIGLTNWYPLKASLQGLKKIGTPEALDLLKRAVDFWMPELDKKQKRIVEEIVAGKR